MAISSMAFTPDLVGSVGVALLLAAFFANIMGWLKSDGLAYSGINLIGLRSPASHPTSSISCRS
jgi:hypothetical protein